MREHFDGDDDMDLGAQDDAFAPGVWDELTEFDAGRADQGLPPFDDHGWDAG